jgi:uncharacterized protein
VDIYAIELAWFDHWLKDEDTGIDRTDRPVHMYELGGARYVDSDRYPFTSATPTTLYLGGGRTGSGAVSQNDGSLGTRLPSAGKAADRAVFADLSEPCRLEADQFGTGPIQLAAELAKKSTDEPATSPCATDERPAELGPQALTYTTTPFSSDTVIAGPVAATIYATSTRPDVELHVTLSDVAPGGKATPLTTGALLGSHRALDSTRTWLGPDGRPLLPYHPYTRAAAHPVPTGQVIRFDVAVFPTLARLANGHRLRLTLATSDTAHVFETPAQLAKLAGGVYAIQRNAAAASSLQVPLAPAGAFPHCFALTPGPLTAGC